MIGFIRRLIEVMSGKFQLNTYARIAYLEKQILDLVHRSTFDRYIEILTMRLDSIDKKIANEIKARTEQHRRLVDKLKEKEIDIIKAIKSKFEVCEQRISDLHLCVQQLDHKISKIGNKDEINKAIKELLYDLNSKKKELNKFLEEAEFLKDLASSARHDYQEYLNKIINISENQQVSRRLAYVETRITEIEIAALKDNK